MKSENKRVALVTGGNRGIGFEIAKQLALKEITVLLGARDEESGNDACDILCGQNGTTVLLVRELRGTNILVNSVCPGWVRTRMGGDEAPITPTEAAETPIWLATLPDGGPTGGFFQQRRPIPW